MLSTFRFKGSGIYEDIAKICDKWFKETVTDPGMLVVSKKDVPEEYLAMFDAVPTILNFDMDRCKEPIGNNTYNIEAYHNLVDDLDPTKYDIGQLTRFIRKAGFQNINQSTLSIMELLDFSVSVFREFFRRLCFEKIRENTIDFYRDIALVRSTLSNAGIDDRDIDGATANSCSGIGCSIYSNVNYALHPTIPNNISMSYGSLSGEGSIYEKLIFLIDYMDEISRKVIRKITLAFDMYGETSRKNKSNDMLNIQLSLSFTKKESGFVIDRIRICNSASNYRPEFVGHVRCKENKFSVTTNLEGDLFRIMHSIVDCFPGMKENIILDIIPYTPPTK